MEDKGKEEWHSKVVGTKIALVSPGVVKVKLEEKSLPATSWSLRDMSSFQKVDFINKALRSYFSLLSWLLLGHSPIVYLEKISNTQS